MTNKNFTCKELKSGALAESNFIHLNAPSMDGKTDAASHGDAIYQRDVRNPARTCQMIELQDSISSSFDSLTNKTALLMPDIPLERSLLGMGCPWHL